MKLKICNFDISKQLKEIGFDIITCTCGGYPECICTDWNHPTLALVQMWLREKYSLNLTIALVANGYEFYLHKDTQTTNEGENYRMHYSYDLALEAGILECIKIIKTKQDET